MIIPALLLYHKPLVKAMNSMDLRSTSYREQTLFILSRDKYIIKKRGLWLISYANQKIPSAERADTRAVGAGGRRSQRNDYAVGKKTG